MSTLNDNELPSVEGLQPAAAPAIPVLPRSPERTVALRKLLEAKDAAVRALIFKPDAPVEQILQFFAYEHLPPQLKAVSKPFCDLAYAIVGETK